jgi:hypothetical protein
MRKSQNQRRIERLLPDEPEAWPKYVRHTVAFNEDLRRLCQEHLAQAHADLEAERDNPDRARYHAYEIEYLQAEIERCTGVILELTALPPGPAWIEAEKNPRRLLS